MDILEEYMPREKMLKFGVDVLTDYELIAIILGTGTKESDVIETSKKIISKYGLENLPKLSISQLKKEVGIGSVKACQIFSCFELGYRIINRKIDKKVKIKSAEDVFNLLNNKLKNLNQEYIYGLFLNTRGYLISEKKIFVGSLTESIINPREIFKFALEENASAVILVHNHPSGECSPSESDLKSTTELIKAGKIMGIEILDHVIIGNNEYWSLSENGVIE